MPVYYKTAFFYFIEHISVTFLFDSVIVINSLYTYEDTLKPKCLYDIAQLDVGYNFNIKQNLTLKTQFEANENDLALIGTHYHKALELLDLNLLNNEFCGFHSKF